MIIFLIPILIVFTCQAMWIWHAYDWQGFPRFRLVTAELIIFFSLIIVISAACEIIPLEFFFIGVIMPVLGWFLLIYLEEALFRGRVRTEESREIRKWLNAIREDPNHYVAYEYLGNIYFERTDYGKALEYYGLSRKIKDTPGLIHKYKLTEKELRIQRGELWVCTECSYENARALAECSNCGHPHSYVAEARVNIAGRREEIKRDSFRVIIGGTVVLLVVWIARALPDMAGIYVALVASLFVMFIMTWKFIKF